MKPLHAATMIGALALLGSGAVLAQTAVPPAQPDKAGFHRLDKNGDGFLSRGEAGAIEGSPKAFDEADENRDGKLSLDEFAKYESLQSRARAGKYVDDSVVTAKVKTALAKELKLASTDVSVETYKGKVILSGFVDSDSERQKAAGVAKTVTGVTEVKNALEVKPR